MNPKFKRSVCWIRRDLRLEDHKSLSEALKHSEEVVICFIFDKTILDHLEDKDDRRMTFIEESLVEIEDRLEKVDSALILRYGDPLNEIPKLIDELKADALFFNRDYEPDAKKRDELVSQKLEKKKISVLSFKDQVIFEGSEIVNLSGGTYKVFTPYKNAWLKKFKFNSDASKQEIKKSSLISKSKIKKHLKKIRIKDLGFTQTENRIKGGAKSAHDQFKSYLKSISEYEKVRNIPSLDATSELSTHLRFGTISIRQCVREAYPLKNKGAQTWLSELIWRDFFSMILDQYPHVVDEPFQIKKYHALKWPGKQSNFIAWCEGKTGYPIVDAAMRCLVQTGWMHNRLRMVVGSFLCKDLLVDWMKGERFFARYLLDYDLSSNNGNWQWCASTGCDAQPYFRVFNPVEQSKRFDPEGIFIKRFCPELNHLSSKEIHFPQGVKGYPRPIVDHKEQRQKAIALFKDLK